MQAYLLGALLFAVGIAVFVFQNNDLVTVKFINWVSPEISLAIVVLAAAGAGAVVTFLLDTFRYIKVARQMQELTAKNRKLQAEIKSLKGEKSAKKKKETIATDNMVQTQQTLVE